MQAPCRSQSLHSLHLLKIDEIFVIGKTSGHISCSLFECEILKKESIKNPPLVDLVEEKKNAEFVRELIEEGIINSCHDISDGGLLVSLFEMCNAEFGCKLDISAIGIADRNTVCFSEDQSRYVVALDSSLISELKKKAEKKSVALFKIGSVVKEKICFENEEVEVSELIKLNESVFEKKFR